MFGALKRWVTEIPDADDRDFRFRLLYLVVKAQNLDEWNTDVGTAARGLITKGESEGLDTLELIELESLLLRSSPDEFLPEWARYLQEEYAHLTERAFAIGCLGDPTAKVAYRAAVVALAAKVQRLRAVRAALGSMRTQTCQWALLMTAAFFTAIVVYVRRGGADEEGQTFWALVTLAGASGGLISGLSRLYALSWTGDLLWTTQNVSRLGTAVLLNLLVAIVEGAAFAIVLTLVFTGRLLRGTIFPDFEPVGVGPATRHVAAASGHCSVPFGVEGAKALVWAFVAGFSERFVPDLLRQLSAGAAKPSEQTAAIRGQPGPPAASPSNT